MEQVKFGEVARLEPRKWNLFNQNSLLIVTYFVLFHYQARPNSFRLRLENKSLPAWTNYRTSKSRPCALVNDILVLRPKTRHAILLVIKLDTFCLVETKTPPKLLVEAKARQITPCRALVLRILTHNS